MNKGSGEERSGSGAAAGAASTQACGAEAAGGTTSHAAPPWWYAWAWRLALPLVALYLCWRGLRQREYLRHWGERFLGLASVDAAAASPPGDPCIWVHAVSVGETRAAQPLIERLAGELPHARFVLTHTTPTGRATGAELAARLPGRVRQRYLPYDLRGPVARFLAQERPDVGVMMETEVWPALMAGARRAGVPMVLANARLSQRSLQRALRHGAWLRRSIAGLHAVGAQSPADAQRIAQLYGGTLVVTGNLKFDLLPDEHLLARGRSVRALMRQCCGHPVLLMASTREGEEDPLLRAIAQAPAPAVWVFVPRHPQRFEEVARQLAATGWPLLRRADLEDPARVAAALATGPGNVLVLGDSMGEMPLYYALADAALIGGSLVPLGGQNLIEAAACGCPVLVGPHMFNFAQAAQDALAAGAARTVPDAASAVSALLDIARDRAVHDAMAAAALGFAAAYRGATDRTADLVRAAVRERATSRAAAGR